MAIKSYNAVPTVDFKKLTIIKLIVLFFHIGSWRDATQYDAGLRYQLEAFVYAIFQTHFLLINSPNWLTLQIMFLIPNESTKTTNLMTWRRTQGQGDLTLTLLPYMAANSRNRLQSEGSRPYALANKSVGESLQHNSSKVVIFVCCHTSCECARKIYRTIRFYKINLFSMFHP